MNRVCASEEVMRITLEQLMHQIKGERMKKRWWQHRVFSATNGGVALAGISRSRFPGPVKGDLCVGVSTYPTILKRGKDRERVLAFSKTILYSEEYDFRGVGALIERVIERLADELGFQEVIEDISPSTAAALISDPEKLNGHTRNSSDIDHTRDREVIRLPS